MKRDIPNLYYDPYTNLNKNLDTSIDKLSSYNKKIKADEDKNTERKLFDETIKTYEQWRYLYKQKYGRSPIKLDPFERMEFMGITTPLVKFFSNKTTGDNIDRKVKDLKDWQNYFDDVQKTRVKKLSDIELQKEIDVGGIDRTVRTPMANYLSESTLQGFKSFYKELLFNSVDDNSPIYEDKIKEKYSTESTIGSTVGTILSFYLTGKALGIAKVPKLLSTVGSKTKVGRIIAQKLGTLPYIYGQKFLGLNKGLVGLSNAIKAEMKITSGIGAVHSVVTMEFLNNLKLTVKDYKKQDGLFAKTKDWKNILTARYGAEFLKSAGQAYFLGVINAPKTDAKIGSTITKAWSARFIGDSIYSTGQQLYGILSGNQKGWNKQQFLNDWLMGHLLGEVQGKLFAPTKMQLKQYFKDKRAFSYGQKVKKKLLDDYGFKLTQAEEMNQGYTLLTAENAYYSKTGKKPSKDFINQGVKNLTKLYKDTYSIILNVKNSEHIDLNRIGSNKDNIKNVIDFLSKKISLTPSEKNHLINNNDIFLNKSKLFNYLKSINKLTKSQGTKEVREPIQDIDQKIEPIKKHRFEDFLDTRLQNEYNIKSLEDIAKPRSFADDGIEIKTPKINTGIRTKEITLSADEFLQANNFKTEIVKYLIDNKNSKQLLNYAKTQTKNKALAEDVVSELYLTINDTPTSWYFNKMGKFTPRKLLTGMIKLNSKHKISQENKVSSINEQNKETETEIQDTLSTEKYTINKNVNYNDPKYALLGELASKNKTGIIESLIVYMRNESNLRYKNKEIVKIFNDNNIKKSKGGNFTESDIKQLNRLANKHLKLIIDKPSYRIKNIPYKVSYTKNEINNIQQRAVDYYRSHNSLSNLNSNLKDNYAKNRIMKNGGYVLSLSRQYEAIKNRFGEVKADDWLFAISYELKNIASRYKKTYLIDTDKTQEIYIKNPESKNNAEFIFYEKDLSPDQLNEFMTHIKHKIDGTSKDTPFKFKIQNKKNKNIYIGDFQDFNIYKINDINNFNNKTLNNLHLIAELLDNINGSKVLVPMFNNIYVDTTSKRIQADIDSINTRYDLNNKSDTEIKDFVYNNPKKIYKEVQDILNESAQIKELIKPFELRKTDPVVNYVDKNIDNENLIIDNNLLSGGEQKLHSFLKADGFDEITQTIMKDFYEYNKQALERRNKQTTTTGKGVMENISSFKDWLSDTVSVYGKDENNPVIRRMKSYIYKMAGEHDQISTLLHRAIVDPLYKAFNPEVTSKQLMAIDKVSNFIREDSFKNVLQNPDIFKEQIKGYEKIMDDVERFKKNPNSLNDKTLNELYNETGDKDVYGKILVQQLGVDNKELVTFLKRMDTDVYKFLDDLYRANNNEYNNIDFFKEKREFAFTELQKLMNKEYNINIKRYKYMDDGVNRLKKIIEQKVGDDETKKEMLMRHLNIFDRFKSENATYTIHRVLKNNNNKEIFNGVINKYLKGENITGKENLDPMMYELMNRKYATLHQLIEAGYTPELSAYKSMSGTVDYAGIKSMNKRYADTLKWNYLDDFYAVYKNWQDTKDSSVMTEFFQSQGYFVKPTLKEFKTYTKLNKKLKEDILELESNTHKTQEQEQRLKKLKLVQEDVNNKIKKLSAFSRTLNDNELEPIIKSTIESMDSLIPLNYKSFINDTTTKVLNDKVKSSMGKLKKNSDINITSWDGIYVPEVMYKGLKQYVMRGDSSMNDPLFKKNLKKIYDKINVTGKIARLVQPFYMLVNDMPQAFIGSGFSFVPEIYNATKSMVNKYNVDYKPKNGLTYWTWNKYNIFNQSVSPSPFVGDITRGFYDTILGNRNIQKGLFSQFKNSMGLKFFQLNENLRTQDGFIKKLGELAKSGTKGLYSLPQDMAWGIDSSLRMSVANSFYKKFIKQTSTEFKIDKLTGKEKTKAIAKAKDKAMFFSAEITNMYMVNYSRIPHATRKALNRLFMFPTFKVGTARMYKELLMQSSKRLYKTFGGKNSGFDPFEGYANSVLPAVRYLGLKYAWKFALANFFGYSFNSITDKLFGYRATKYDDKGDSFNSVLHYLSVGGSMYELEKLHKRGFVKYLAMNLAYIPAMAYQLYSNKAFATGKQIYDAKDFKYRPIEGLTKIGLFAIKNTLPLSTVNNVMAISDFQQDRMKWILHNLGFAYFYKTKTASQLFKDFDKAFNESVNLYDRNKAFKDFRHELIRLNNVRLGEQQPDAFESINKLYEKRNELLHKKK